MSIELLLYDRATAGSGNLCQRIDVDTGSPYGWRLLKPFHTEILPEGYGVYKRSTSVVQTLTGPQKGETLTLYGADGRKALADLFAFYWGGGAAGFANIHHDYATIGANSGTGNADWAVLGTACDWSKIWFGAGAKWGGQLVAGGVENTVAWIWNAEDSSKRAFLNVQGIRIGPGLGASVGGTFVLAVGLADPLFLLNYQTSGFDFSVSLEEKWSAVIGFLANQKYLPALSFLVTTVIQKGGALDQGQWESYANFAKLVAAGVGVGREMSLSSFDVPYAGKGLEVTLCYSTSTVTSVQPF